MSDQEPDENSNTGSIQDKSKNDKAKYLGAVASSLLLAILSAGSRKSEETAEKENQRADEHLIATATHRMAKYTKRLLIATIASVGTAIVTAGVLTYQLIEMRKAYGPLKDSADAAKLAANSAQDSVRAWVGAISFAFVDLKSDDPLKVRVTYQNVGKEPAEDVALSVSSSFMIRPTYPVELWKDLPDWHAQKALESETQCKKTRSVNIRSTVYPSNSFGYFADTAKIVHMPGLPDSDIPNLFGWTKRETVIYIVNGCISYKTEGKRRYSSFCAFLNPAEGGPMAKWPFSACPVGNKDYNADGKD